MPDPYAPFEDLPILAELRDDLGRAFTAHAHQGLGPERSGLRRRARRVRPLARFGGHSRRPLAVAGGAGGIAAAAIAVALLASPATQPAYALTQNSNGSVTVTIHDLETAIPALNGRFAAMGIDETVVPVSAGCPSAGARHPLFADPQETPSDSFTFYPSHKYLEPGYNGVVAAEQLSNGEVAIAMEAVRPPVPSCFSTTVYTMRRAGSTRTGVPIYRLTPSSDAAAAAVSRSGS